MTENTRWVDGITDSVDRSFEHAPGDGEGPGMLQSMGSQRDTTEQLDNDNNNI